jgi:hypothetical protein
VSTIVRRVRGLLLGPREEIVRALADTSARDTWLYVLALAAVGPLAAFLAHGLVGEYRSTTVFNLPGPATWVRAPVAAAVLATVRFGVAIGAWQLGSALLSLSAPLFGGRRDLDGARRATALTATPLFIAGIGELAVCIPYFAWLRWLVWTVAVVYATCIATWSAPSFVGTSDDKALGHAILTVAATLIASALAYAVVGFVVVALVVG